MEASPPRRRETFSSLQLQRAADQLQDAIHSVRQRRSMHSSRSTSLSMLSDSSGDDDVNDPDDSDEDQENQPANGSDATVSKLLCTTSPDSKLRRFTGGAVVSRRRSGASLSLKDLHASPLRPPRDLQTMKQQIRSDLEKRTASIATEAVKSDDSAVQKSVDDHLRVDVTAHKALAVLQTELEDQAKANRVMQDQIKQALTRIDAFVTEAVDKEERVGLDSDADVVGKPLTVDKVQQLSDGWIDALEQWKDAMEREDNDRAKQWEETNHEMQRKMEAQQESHKSELGAVQAELEAKCSEINELQEQIDALHSAAERAQIDMIASDRDSMQLCERLQMENEDLRGLLAATTEETEPVDEPSAEQQQRHVLNLIAQLKQSELRELQWEMLFQEQCQETTRTKERLEMLLEDVRLPAVPSQSPPRASSTTSLPCSLSPKARRASFASSTTSSELQLYQQRIEFLEDQLRDVRDQINCDHQQFLYEQQKWEVEKKSMGHEVEEVHGVSVKVLKLLLIREKLLKRHEAKLQKRVDKLKLREQSFDQSFQLLQVSLDTTMQECAVALLYVRQLAMMPPTGEHSVPVKPIKIVRLLKRLKNLHQELASGGDVGSCSGSRSSAAPC